VKISSTLSVSSLLVNALTNGTITIETAIAATPISGDFAAAAANPSLPPLHLEPEKLTLHVGEHTVSLTEKETAVLALLLARRGDTVKKEELHRVISDGADRASNKVEVYMCHLRRKLEQPLGLRLFSTVRGLGYCLLTGYENGKDTL
jgi:DNA-binding response OmpR family regulator